jgi:serralysin
VLSGLPSGKRNRRTSRPSPESLETRALLSGYSPTDIEQLYLEELDDARFNPAAYGVSLGLDLSTVAPSQPLAMSPLLVEAARLHSQDMIAQNYFSHTTPQGVGPEQRIQAAGFNPTGYAESIEYNTNETASDTPFPADYAGRDTVSSLSNLIVDQGVPDLGHRVMLLDIGGQFHADRQVGIGIASQDTTSSGFINRQTDTTIDLAGTSDSDPFLTGVVFDDTVGNGEYQPGEGLGGVTISVSNVGTTTTLDAGGYSLQVPAGIYTVTASGGGLPSPITRTVVVQNDNMRLNFDENPDGATLSAASDNAVSGLLGSFTPMQPGDTASSYSARIDWGDGNASFATLTPDANGTFDVAGSNTYADPGVYSVRVLVTHLSDGQTLALNATVFVGSTAPVSSNPGPANPGQGSSTQGGSGQGTSGTGTSGQVSDTGNTQGAHHKKTKHPKLESKPKHKTHPTTSHKTKAHPVQGAKKVRHLHE